MDNYRSRHHHHHSSHRHSSTSSSHHSSSHHRRYSSSSAKERDSPCHRSPSPSVSNEHSSDSRRYSSSTHQLDPRKYSVKQHSEKKWGAEKTYKSKELSYSKTEKVLSPVGSTSSSKDCDRTSRDSSVESKNSNKRNSSGHTKKSDDLNLQKMLLYQYQQSNALLAQNINALCMLNQQVSPTAIMAPLKSSPVSVNKKNIPLNVVTAANSHFSNGSTNSQIKNSSILSSVQKSKLNSPLMSPFVVNNISTNLKNDRNYFNFPRHLSVTESNNNVLTSNDNKKLKQEASNYVKQHPMSSNARTTSSPSGRKVLLKQETLLSLKNSCGISNSKLSKSVKITSDGQPIILTGGNLKNSLSNKNSEEWASVNRNVSNNVFGANEDPRNNRKLVKILPKGAKKLVKILPKPESVYDVTENVMNSINAKPEEKKTSDKIFIELLQSRTLELKQLSNAKKQKSALVSSAAQVKTVTVAGRDVKPRTDGPKLSVLDYINRKKTGHKEVVSSAVQNASPSVASLLSPTTNHVTEAKNFKDNTETGSPTAVNYLSKLSEQIIASNPHNNIKDLLLTGDKNKRLQGKGQTQKHDITSGSSKASKTSGSVVATKEQLQTHCSDIEDEYKAFLESIGETEKPLSSKDELDSQKQSITSAGSIADITERNSLKSNLNASEPSANLTVKARDETMEEKPEPVVSCDEKKAMGSTQSQKPLSVLPQENKHSSEKPAHGRGLQRTSLTKSEIERALKKLTSDQRGKILASVKKLPSDDIVSQEKSKEKHGGKASLTEKPHENEEKRNSVLKLKLSDNLKSLKLPAKSLTLPTKSAKNEIKNNTSNIKNSFKPKLSAKEMAKDPFAFPGMTATPKTLIAKILTKPNLKSKGSPKIEKDPFEFPGTKSTKSLLKAQANKSNSKLSKPSTKEIERDPFEFPGANTSQLISKSPKPSSSPFKLKHSQNEISNRIEATKAKDLDETSKKLDVAETNLEKMDAMETMEVKSDTLEASSEKPGTEETNSEIGQLAVAKEQPSSIFSTTTVTGKRQPKATLKKKAFLEELNSQKKKNLSRKLKKVEKTTPVKDQEELKTVTKSSGEDSSQKKAKTGESKGENTPKQTSKRRKSTGSSAKTKSSSVKKDRSVSSSGKENVDKDHATQANTVTTEKSPQYKIKGVIEAAVDKTPKTKVKGVNPAKTDKPALSKGKETTATELTFENVVKTVVNSPNVQKKFKCKTCGAEFWKEPELLKHSNIHKGRTYDCYKCDEKCTTMRALTKHLLMHDESAVISSHVPHDCEKCGEKFETENQLLVHLQIHERKEVEHACTLCSVKYQSLTELYAHIAKSHPQDMQEILRCSKCKTSFDKLGDFRTHLMTVHKMNTKEASLACRNKGVIPEEFKQLEEERLQYLKSKKRAKGLLLRSGATVKLQNGNNKLDNKEDSKMLGKKSASGIMKAKAVVQKSKKMKRALDLENKTRTSSRSKDTTTKTAEPVPSTPQEKLTTAEMSELAITHKSKNRKTALLRTVKSVFKAQQKTGARNLNGQKSSVKGLSSMKLENKHKEDADLNAAERKSKGNDVGDLAAIAVKTLLPVSRLEDIFDRVENAVQKKKKIKSSDSFVISPAEAPPPAIISTTAAFAKKSYLVEDVAKLRQEEEHKRVKHNFESAERTARMLIRSQKRSSTDENSKSTKTRKRSVSETQPGEKLEPIKLKVHIKMSDFLTPETASVISATSVRTTEGESKLKSSGKKNRKKKKVPSGSNTKKEKKISGPAQRKRRKYYIYEDELQAMQIRQNFLNESVDSGIGSLTSGLSATTSPYYDSDVDQFATPNDIDYDMDFDYSKQSHEEIFLTEDDLLSSLLTLSDSSVDPTIKKKMEEANDRVIQREVRSKLDEILHRICYNEKVEILDRMTTDFESSTAEATTPNFETFSLRFTPGADDTVVPDSSRIDFTCTTSNINHNVCFTPSPTTEHDYFGFVSSGDRITSACERPSDKPQRNDGQTDLDDDGCESIVTNARDVNKESVEQTVAFVVCKLLDTVNSTGKSNFAQTEGITGIEILDNEELVTSRTKEESTRELHTPNELFSHDLLPLKNHLVCTTGEKDAVDELLRSIVDQIVLTNDENHTPSSCLEAKPSVAEKLVVMSSHDRQYNTLLNIESHCDDFSSDVKTLLENETVECGDTASMTNSKNLVIALKDVKCEDERKLDLAAGTEVHQKILLRKEHINGEVKMSSQAKEEERNKVSHTSLRSLDSEADNSSLSFVSIHSESHEDAVVKDVLYELLIHVSNESELLDTNTDESVNTDHLSSDVQESIMIHVPHSTVAESTMIQAHGDPKNDGDNKISDANVSENVEGNVISCVVDRTDCKNCLSSARENTDVEPPCNRISKVSSTGKNSDDNIANITSVFRDVNLSLARDRINVKMCSKKNYHRSLTGAEEDILSDRSYNRTSDASIKSDKVVDKCYTNGNKTDASFVEEKIYDILETNNTPANTNLERQLSNDVGHIDASKDVTTIDDVCSVLKDVVSSVASKLGDVVPVESIDDDVSSVNKNDGALFVNETNTHENVDDLITSVTDNYTPILSKSSQNVKVDGEEVDTVYSDVLSCLNDMLKKVETSFANTLLNFTGKNVESDLSQEKVELLKSLADARKTISKVSVKRKNMDGEDKENADEIDTRRRPRRSTRLNTIFNDTPPERSEANNPYLDYFPMLDITIKQEPIDIDLELSVNTEEEINKFKSPIKSFVSREFIKIIEPIDRMLKPPRKKKKNHTNKKKPHEEQPVEDISSPSPIPIVRVYSCYNETNKEYSCNNGIESKTLYQSNDSFNSGNEQLLKTEPAVQGKCGQVPSVHSQTDDILTVETKSWIDKSTQTEFVFDSFVNENQFNENQCKRESAKVTANLSVQTEEFPSDSQGKGTDGGTAKDSIDECVSNCTSVKASKPVVSCIETSHVNELSTNYAVTCKLCRESFTSKSQHDSHTCPQFPVNGTRNVKYSKNVQNKDDYTRSFDCRKCGNEFGCRRNLLRHRMFAHSHMDNKHKCSICGRAFLRQSYLKTHKRTHEKKLKVIASDMHGVLPNETVVNGDAHL